MTEVIKKGGLTKALAHGSLPDTPTEVIDQYIRELNDHKREWAHYPVASRIRLLQQVQRNIVKYLDEWAEQDLKARHIPEGHPETMISYRSPGLVGVANRNYIYTLKQLKLHGGSRPYVKARQKGQRVIIRSFPRNMFDKLLFHKIRAEIWLKPGTRRKKIKDYQAVTLRDKNNNGGIAFIMSAGNVSASTFADLYQKLIMEKQVCIIKTHPVQEYMVDILSKVLAPFIEAGFVRIVSGGAVVGSYISHHPLIKAIAFTGSDKTFDALVYGTGPDSLDNKKKDHRQIDKDVACELGSVSPVIVVPGDWTGQELDYQARNIFSMLANNNGYACVAARMLILPKKWDKSSVLIEKLEDLFQNSVKAVNYYPGTEQTVQEALELYPKAQVFGELDKKSQPFIFAKGLSPRKNETAYTREFWATFMGQTYMDGEDTAEYLSNAVKFAR